MLAVLAYIHIFEPELFRSDSYNPVTQPKPYEYYYPVLSKYAVFSGRARRSEYWYFVLFNLIAFIICSVIDLTLGTIYLSSIYRLILLIPSIAVGVRRIMMSTKVDGIS